MANSTIGTVTGSRSFSAVSTSNPLNTYASTTNAATLVTDPLDPTLSGSTSARSATASVAATVPPLGNGTGLQAQYYTGRNFNTLKQTRLDGYVNFNWGNGSPASSVSADNFSVRWSGQILPRYTETYTFYTRSDDGVRLWVNGRLLVDDWNAHPLKENSGSIVLTAGQKYDIKLEYFDGGGTASASLMWSSPSQGKQVVPQSQLFSNTTGGVAPVPLPDLAGNTLNAARAISNAATSAFSDSLTSSDLDDYYRFSLTTPSTFKVALSGLDAEAKIEVLDSNGQVVRSATNATNSGLKAEYFDNADFTNLKLVRRDTNVDFDWKGSSPDASIGADTFSVRWTGKIQPKFSETYTFYTNSDDGARLWINGQQVINRWQGGSAENSGTITLQAGQKYDIKLEYFESGFGARAQLLWSSPSQQKQVIPQNQLFSVSDKVVDDALPAGTYYLRVFSQTGINTNYQLSLTSQTARETARSAFSFIDSVGINTHLRYYDTSYGNFSLIQQRLQELGVRHIRDGGTDSTWVQRVNQLGNLGIKTTVVVDPNIGIVPNASYTMRSPSYEIVSFIKNVVPSGVEAVEILNEFDYFSTQYQYTYNGQPITSANWVDYVRNMTRDTYAALNSDPATQNIAVIGPSFIYGDSSTKVGDLSQWVDYGNMHPYNYPAYPGNGNLANELANRSQPFGSHPLIATEVGWHTGGANSSRAVSEAVQGKYIPRMFLENFRQGVPRTFSYELIDQRANPNNGEDNFGLLRSDGSPKPAFTAQQNLMTLLSDASSTFTTGSLDYYLKGNTQNVHHTLLQKSNGEFYLVLWSEVASTNQDVTQQVTLNLMSGVKQATTYLPNRSLAATGQYTNPTKLTLNVPDHPLVIKLTPA